MHAAGLNFSGLSTAQPGGGVIEKLKSGFSIVFPPEEFLRRRSQSENDPDAFERREEDE